MAENVREKLLSQFILRDLERPSERDLNGLVDQYVLLNKSNTSKVVAENLDCYFALIEAYRIGRNSRESRQ